MTEIRFQWDDRQVATPAAPAAPGRVEAFTAARAQAICPACGGFAEHFDGCHLDPHHSLTNRQEVQA